MTFFSNLRDNVATQKIIQFGQPATYTQYDAAVYDNETGVVTDGVATVVNTHALDLPLNENEFTEEVRAQSSGKLLVAASAFAAAGVEPQPNALIVLSTRPGYTYTIVALKVVSPSGEDVVYTMAVK